VYGCTKFHQYVYGKKVNVQTDHKPLEALLKKNIIPSTTEIAANHAKVTTLWPENEVWDRQKLFIADTLSRAPEVSNETAANTKDEFEVLTLESIPVSEVK